MLSAKQIIRWGCTAVTAVAILSLSFAFTAAGSNIDRIRIISPEADKPVSGPDIRLSMELPATGGHLHVYLDNKIKLMLDTDKLEGGELVIKDVPAGKHAIKVVLSTSHHTEMNQLNYKDEITFFVE